MTDGIEFNWTTKGLCLAIPSVCIKLKKYMQDELLISYFSSKKISEQQWTITGGW